MAKIPLNKFRSIYRNIVQRNLDNSSWLDTGIPETTYNSSRIYSPPQLRAGIAILLQIANTTSSEKLISAAIAHTTPPSLIPSISEGPYQSFYLAQKIPVPPNDAISLLTGRLVLFGDDGFKKFPDILFIAANEPGLVLSMGVLETVNRD